MIPPEQRDALLWAQAHKMALQYDEPLEVCYGWLKQARLAAGERLRWCIQFRNEADTHNYTYCPPKADLDAATLVWDGEDIESFRGKHGYEVLPYLEAAIARLGGPADYDRWPEQPHYWTLWWLESIRDCAKQHPDDYVLVTGMVSAA